MKHLSVPALLFSLILLPSSSFSNSGGRLTQQNHSSIERLFRSHNGEKILLTDSPPPRTTNGTYSYVAVIDSALVFDFDDTNKVAYRFDNFGRRTSALTRVYFHGSWKNQLLESTTFERGGKTRTITTSGWHENHWEPSYRWEIVESDDGSNVTQLYRELYTGANTDSRRIVSVYDSAGHLKRQTQEHFTDGRWVNLVQSDYTYGPTGEQIMLLNSAWDGTQWTNSDRTSSSYDTTGKLITELREFWSVDHWVNSWRSNTEYEPASNTSFETFEDYVNDQWVRGDRRTEYGTPDGNLTLILEESWMNGQWFQAWRASFAYDREGNMSSVVSESWNGSSWIPAGGIFTTIDDAGNSYTLRGTSVSFFRSYIAIASTQPVESPSFTLSTNYPNPFNPATTIWYQLEEESNVSVVVFNPLGQQIATLINSIEPAGDKLVRFDATGFPSGTYFYRIEAASTSDPSKRFRQTRKMLLVR